MSAHFGLLVVSQSCHVGAHGWAHVTPSLISLAYSGKEGIIAWSGGGEQAEVKGRGGHERRKRKGLKRRNRDDTVLIIHPLDYQLINA